MVSVVPGPTYAEMRDPSLLTSNRRAAAQAARAEDLDSGNLFNLTWQRDDGSVNALVLPPTRTRVAANIIVLLGGPFPTGSPKVGAAYAMLAEAEALEPGRPGT